MQDSWLVFFLKLLISAFKTIQASVYESPVTTDCVEFLWGREKGNVSPMLCIENIVKLCFWYWTKTCCHFYTLLRNRAASQNHLPPSSPPPAACVSLFAVFSLLYPVRSALLFAFLLLLLCCALIMMVSYKKKLYLMGAPTGFRAARHCVAATTLWFSRLPPLLQCCFDRVQEAP